MADTTLEDISDKLETLNDTTASGNEAEKKSQNIMLSKLSDTFSENFSTLASSLKPSNMLGMLGASFSSPIVNMMGSKLGGIESYISSSLKDSFQKEAKEDKALDLQERSADALDKIAGNTENISDADGENGRSLMDKLSPTKLLKGFLGKIGGKGGGGLLSALTMRSGGLVKLLMRGLGKMALPVALLFGAKDFIRGMKNVESIAGNDNIIDSIEVGVAEVISKLTFGLLSTKTIYKGIDYIKDQFIQVMRTPFVMIREILKGEKDIKDIISDGISAVISGMTAGIFSKEKVGEGIDYLIGKVIDIFKAPIKLIEDLFTSEKPIVEILRTYIEEQISAISFGMFSEESVGAAVDYLVEKMKFLIAHPIESIENMFNAYMDFLELPPVDITGFVDNQVDKISIYFDDILNSIVNFKDAIFDKIKDKFGSALDFFTDDDTDISSKELKKSLTTKDKKSNKNNLLINTKGIPEPFDSDIEQNKKNNKIAYQFREMDGKTKRTDMPIREEKTTNVTSVVNNNIQQNRRDTSTGFPQLATSLF